jgi:hypothetical protein
VALGNHPHVGSETFRHDVEVATRFLRRALNHDADLLDPPRGHLVRKIALHGASLVVGRPDVNPYPARYGYARSRKPSVIAFTSGMPVRPMALMRAFISAMGRNGLAASRSA